MQLNSVIRTTNLSLPLYLWIRDFSFIIIICRADIFSRSWENEEEFVTVWYNEKIGVVLLKMK